MVSARPAPAGAAMALTASFSAPGLSSSEKGQVQHYTSAGDEQRVRCWSRCRDATAGFLRCGQYRLGCHAPKLASGSRA